MRYLVLLLALSGCAGGLQAFDAPGMPAPVFTPVGAGAPVLGQPGQHRSPPVLPPSPNKRILPLTREPGIWAADEIRAASAPPATLEIAEVDVPSETKNGTEEIRACRAVVLNALITTNTLEALRTLPLPERTCEVFRLQADCLSRKRVAKERESILRAAHNRTAYQRNKACKDIPEERFKHIRAPVERILRDTVGRWKTVSDRDPGQP